MWSDGRGKRSRLKEVRKREEKTCRRLLVNVICRCAEAPERRPDPRPVPLRK